MAVVLLQLSDSNQGDKVMYKIDLQTGALACALFMIVVAVPDQAEAMNFSNMASAPDIWVTAKPEQARWCRVRECRSRYYEPPPYYWGWGWYRPWPYYPYYNFGTGQSNFGFAR
jgi:hypothetical protein